MTKRHADKDLLDTLSDFLAHNKGLLVFVGVGLAALSMLLSLIVGPESGAGFWAWLAQTHLLLHLGVIVGLLGILIGDAL
jgi:uncharacterized membrane protein